MNRYHLHWIGEHPNRTYIVVDRGDGGNVVFTSQKSIEAMAMSYRLNARVGWDCLPNEPATAEDDRNAA